MRLERILFISDTWFSEKHYLALESRSPMYLDYGLFTLKKA